MQKLLPPLRKLCPKATIILGGPEATYAPACFPDADLILPGAGEVFWLPALKALAAGRPPRQIEIPAQPAFAATWPFPYDEADKERLRHRLLYYESSRGCPFRCGFCLSSADRRLAFLPLERVFEDLERLIALAPSVVKFVDRTFNQPPKRAAQILRFLLTKAAPGLTFHFEMKGELLNDEMIGLLRSAPPHFFQLEVGLQSTDRAALAAIGREWDREKLIQNLRRVLDGDNVHLHLDLIAGLPREGLKQFKESFETAWSIRPHHLQLGFLKLLPGTALAENAAAYGYLSLQNPPYEVLANDALSFTDMNRIHGIEQLLEREYNRGCRHLSLPYGAKIYAGGSFAFFLALAAEKETGFAAALQKVAPQKPGFWAALCRLEDFLKRRQNPVTAAEEAAALSFLRDENNICRFLPRRHRERPQDIYKTIRLLDSDFTFSIQHGELTEGQDRPCRLLLDYSQREGIRAWPKISILPQG